MSLAVTIFPDLKDEVTLDMSEKEKEDGEKEVEKELDEKFASDHFKLRLITVHEDQLTARFEIPADAEYHDVYQTAPFSPPEGRC